MYSTRSRGLVWRAEGDAFMKDTGESVATANLATADDHISAYYDAAYDVFSVVTTSGYQGAYHPSKSHDPFPCILFSPAQQADGRWHTDFVGVLLAGSTNVKMTFLPAASNPTVTTVTAASGQVFLVASATTATESGELFDLLTYTDGQGKMVTPAWGTP